ncbi:MAG: sigma 54-interacting transcriptional regulator [Deltaproteobacteria bacterium]|nr:sigma 54-interacting transcriptional regulator [Deltaproteobacteria bacterium]
MAYQVVRSAIRQARRLFRQNEPIPEGLLRPEILESWMRSRSYGLEFDKADKRLLSIEAIRERIRERRDLYETALPVMEKLYDFTAGSGCLTTLSDEEGYMLKAMGDKEIMEIARKNKFMEGCNRSERRLGTNGIGTPLVTHRPIQVFAEEHYYELHHYWVCSGAPIFDPAGKAIGVFCVTGLFDKVSYHTLGLAAAAADSITQQLAMKQAYSAMVRTQQRMKVIVETVPSGILLCNRDMEILQCNSRAAALLVLPESQIVGKKLHDILGKEPFAHDELQQKLDDKDITIERDGLPLHFVFSLTAADTDDYVITFVKTESFHKKVHRVIGSEAYFTFDNIVGQAPAVLNAVSLARIAAANNSTVLLTGESGTGKELFAQSIHNGGARRAGPFVALNCAALPKSLIESELFGYESGSFTGARREGSAGKFELANGGTIFLDEIGDMPLDVQASLLRVLQNREVSRIGSSKATKIDVRIIAASNKNLPAAIKMNAFRADLYYRLNVFSIHIPPLRERTADIRLLADYFLRKYADLSSRLIEGFTDAAYRALEKHIWHGNIRELENVIERSVYVARSRLIDVESLLLKPSTHNPLPALYGTDTELAAAFRTNEAADAAKKALTMASGNMRLAAELLGVSRRTLYRRLADMGLQPADLRQK